MDSLTLEQQRLVVELAQSHADLMRKNIVA